MFTSCSTAVHGRDSVVQLADVELSIKLEDISSCITNVQTSFVLFPLVKRRVVTSLSIVPEMSADRRTQSPTSVLFLLLRRSDVVLGLLCCTTDGAVGKKSAKPAVDRDMMRNG